MAVITITIDKDWDQIEVRQLHASKFHLIVAMTALAQLAGKESPRALAIALKRTEKEIKKGVKNENF